MQSVFEQTTAMTYSKETQVVFCTYICKVTLFKSFNISVFPSEGGGLVGGGKGRGREKGKKKKEVGRGKGRGGVSGLLEKVFGVVEELLLFLGVASGVMEEILFLGVASGCCGGDIISRGSL